MLFVFFFCVYGKSMIADSFTTTDCSLMLWGESMELIIILAFNQSVNTAANRFCSDDEIVHAFWWSQPLNSEIIKNAMRESCISYYFRVHLSDDAECQQLTYRQQRELEEDRREWCWIPRSPSLALWNLIKDSWFANGSNRRETFSIWRILSAVEKCGWTRIPSCDSLGYKHLTSLCKNSIMMHSKEHDYFHSVVADCVSIREVRATRKFGNLFESF